MSRKTRILLEGKALGPDYSKARLIRNLSESPHFIYTVTNEYMYLIIGAYPVAAYTGEVLFLEEPVKLHSKERLTMLLLQFIQRIQSHPRG